MMCCQFIFKPGTSDEDFHRLNGQIDEYARALPGFVRTETYTANNTGVVNAIYYFEDKTSVAQLARFPQHREAKSQVQRWYDGYRIVVSEVTATYGDGRLADETVAAVTVAPRPTCPTGASTSGAGRPNKHDPATLDDATWFVHGGNRADDTTGAIRTPIVMANSYRLPEDPTTIDNPDYNGLVYTREHGANQLGLERKLAALDHGPAAAVFGTGMAALHATFLTLLNPGDHAVISNVCYGRTRGLFETLLPAKLGIDVDFVDITDLDVVRATMRPTTRLVHTEAIANPDLRIADIAALADIAHRGDARLTVDSTFTPPPLLRPLDLGADRAIHSLTKYFNGHGDAMGGAVIGPGDLIEQIRTGELWHAGGAISPFNAWLIMRGSVTLPLRVRRQCDTAHQLARFLDADPRIAHVAYPGLADSPHHELAQRQLHGGYGAVISFAIAGSHDDRVRFVNDLRVITSAVSLGHDEALIAYENYPPERATVFDAPFREHGLIRLAVGLEDADDLIDDLDAALTTAYGPAR